MQWESDLIGYDAAHAYGSPGYYAQSLFAEYLGSEVPASSLAGGGDRFFYSVTRDPARGVVYLKLVNATSFPQNVEIAMTGVEKVSSTATLFTLSGSNTAETNSISDPRRIIPVKSSIRTADKFAHTMPAYAVQIIAIDVK